MLFRGSASINNDDGSSLGKNHWREEGMGRIGKYAYVEDVDVEADGKGLSIPSYSTVDGQGDGVGYEEDAPPTNSKGEPLKKIVSRGQPS